MAHGRSPSGPTRGRVKGQRRCVADGRIRVVHQVRDPAVKAISGCAAV
jgi:hypothetical protein